MNGVRRGLGRHPGPPSPDFVARVKRIYDDQHYRILANQQISGSLRSDFQSRSVRISPLEAAPPQLFREIS
jgi:hypothetical protein